MANFEKISRVTLLCSAIAFSGGDVFGTDTAPYIFQVNGKKYVAYVPTTVAANNENQDSGSDLGGPIDQSENDQTSSESLLEEKSDTIETPETPETLKTLETLTENLELYAKQLKTDEIESAFIKTTNQFTDIWDKLLKKNAELSPKLQEQAKKAEKIIEDYLSQIHDGKINKEALAQLKKNLELLKKNPELLNSPSSSKSDDESSSDEYAKSK
ncbi:MAG: hypothetical protein LBB11_00490 [Puniceicoccales bacterium]|jgi:hypothetical protein|nr:hypothetical protein [Puniceicoccales bacterium]